MRAGKYKLIFFFLMFQSGLYFSGFADDTLKVVVRDSSRTLVNLGIERLNTRDYQGAIAYFTKAIEYDSTFAQAYIHRAQVKRELLDYSGAISDYNRALKQKLTWEESYEIHFNKALLCIFSNDNTPGPG